MTRLNKIIALFFALTIGLFATSCSNNQNPADYNNKLMTLMNQNETDMNAMNAAMSAADYNQAEQVRKSWAQHLTDALKEAKDMDEFDGNSDLKNAVVSGLESYRKIVSEDYKQLIVIRSSGDQTQQAKESKLLNNINDAFENAGSNINKASSEFESKFAK